MNRLILLVESRIRGDVYVRFGGELPKTHRSNTAGRWMLSLRLRKVKNLVRDARKVQQTILMVGDITEIYVTSYERMLSDPYFTPEELSAIALGYTKLLEESANLLTDLKTVVNENGLSMNDKERMDIIDRCYTDMLQYRSLVQYYTNKNIGVSYLRAKKQNDLDRVMALYGSPNERYW
ncbi:MAG: conjugal transfer protein TraI [Bacteroides sp.]|uniref:conjugal transfer protein TraI n=1 Tax=Bacteroides sp. TaxID=29523 RepID=UPI0026E00E5F|nr:conjugal transfer protein TraI [Bacteroides sp.]MDO5420189.1 conjugal transfer protein TraI [Bacteroides sp.]